MRTVNPHQKQAALGISCLPGYKIPVEFTKTQFNKQHTLDYNNGYAVSKSVDDKTKNAADKDEQEIADLLSKATAHLRFGDRAGNYSQKSKPVFEDASVNVAPLSVEEQVGANPGSAAKSFVPSFAALDKIVLRFDAYIKEIFPDGNRGPWPGATPSDQEHVIRRVMIKYFIEDDSISVVEPPVENSGLAQGVLMKRQLLPKPVDDMVGGQVQYYTIQDFALGKDMTLYGKTFRIIGCDLFTENYMRDVLKTPLKQLGPVETAPQDPYIEARNRTKRLTKEHTHSNSDAEPTTDKLKKFLLNDRKVLRFYCSWDDRESLYGEIREFIIHYFLVDDCIEVREVQTANSGRDPFPIMLRRQMLPKQVDGLADLATTTPLGTDLDVVRYKNTSDRYYSWRDMRIGAQVNVLSRKFLIYDCDSYTRSFFVENTGEDMRAIRRHEVLPQEGAIDIQKSSDEPTTKKNNIFKMLANEGKTLRFGAYLQSKHKEDQGRRFVVVYRLADDQMSIYERQIRNAGIVGGKFMDRASPANPDTGKEYLPADLYVGATIWAYRHAFVLYDADDFVFKWMEERAKDFPKSDVEQIVPKVQQLPKANLQAAFEQAEQTAVSAKAAKASVAAKVPGVLSREQFCATLTQVAQAAQVPLHEHEAITIARRFLVGSETPKKVSYYHFLEAL